MKNDDENKSKFTFSGADYFKRMKEKNLYTTDTIIIKKRVEKEGLTNIYDKKLI